MFSCYQPHILTYKHPFSPLSSLPQAYTYHWDIQSASATGSPLQLLSIHKPALLTPPLKRISLVINYLCYKTHFKLLAHPLHIIMHTDKTRNKHLERMRKRLKDIKSKIQGDRVYQSNQSINQSANQTIRHTFNIISLFGRNKTGPFYFLLVDHCMHGTAPSETGL